jgi:hypothetical protein
MSPVDLVGSLTFLYVQLSECHRPGHFAPNQWSPAPAANAALHEAKAAGDRVELEIVRVINTPEAPHIRYRVRR